MASTYRYFCDKLFGREVTTYGFGDIIRLYCNYPKCLPLPVNVYHGWYIENPRQSDLNDDRRLLLTFNRRQADEWKMHSDKLVAVLGAPFVHYRRLLKIERQANARGTIVYPGHNATSFDFEFDVRDMCERLVGLDRKFHPITVSVFEGDIVAGKDKIYREYGFRTFCPGPRKTIEFCKSFYSELAKHRFSCGNHFGTNILYSVEMDIPFFFVGEMGKGIVRNTGETVAKDRTIAHLSLLDKIRDLFRDPVNEVTPEQREFVLSESGIDDCLSPDHLRSLLISVFARNALPSAFRRIASWPYRAVRRRISPG
jgi:hypothetical protein